MLATPPARQGRDTASAGGARTHGGFFRRAPLDRFLQEVEGIPSIFQVAAPSPQPQEVGEQDCEYHTNCPVLGRVVDRFSLTFGVVIYQAKRVDAAFRNIEGDSGDGGISPRAAAA